MTPIIEVKNLGKKYDIAHQRGRYVSLRDVIMNIIRAPFVFMKTKAKQVVGLSEKEEFWALDKINFSVNRGEVIGIIGRNGAGKSTLLKILSQITPPTTGEIRIEGRVGSLLEVGTGFHPELSGRENIFLNGAILGMKKTEIIEKFDKIVAFAGVEKFLDTPVKHYSSGMYVRLAFSVAAHMEPDILIVDEVLAVGDTEFQKKCLGKMDEITKNDGRTILFVSHNMSAIKQLCPRTILLEGGKIKRQGPTAEVIDEYLNIGTNTQGKNQYVNLEFPADPHKQIQIKKMRVFQRKNISGIDITLGTDFTIETEYEVREPIESVFISLILLNQDNQRVIDFMEIDADPTSIQKKQPGTYIVSVTVPGLLNQGLYEAIIVLERGQETLDKRGGLMIKIIDTHARIYNIQGRASIIPKVVWETRRS